jgi:RNA polymerase sigma-70 factor (ECF subfamily)
MKEGIADWKERRWLALFSISDEEAMLRVRRRNDAGAFALLVRRWEGRIQRFCTRLCADPHRAEDLAQEAFARVYASRQRYQPKARFSTFLWRVALNVCRDDHRSQTRRAAACPQDRGAGDDIAEVAGRDPLPDSALFSKERAEAVRDVLAQLSEEHRSVVILRHYEGLKLREIAETLGIPEGTVKSRMAEALTRLARDLRLKTCFEDDFARPRPGESEGTEGR